MTFVEQKCFENERMRLPCLLVLALSNYGILKLALIHQFPLPTSLRSEALSLDDVLLQKSRLIAPSTSPGADDRAHFRAKVAAFPCRMSTRVDDTCEAGQVRCKVPETRV